MEAIKHGATRTLHLQDRKIREEFDFQHHPADCLPPWVTGAMQVLAIYQKTWEAAEQHLASQF